MLTPPSRMWLHSIPPRCTCALATTSFLCRILTYRSGTIDRSDDTGDKRMRGKLNPSALRPWHVEAERAFRRVGLLSKRATIKATRWASCVRHMRAASCVQYDSLTGYWIGAEHGGDDAGDVLGVLCLAAFGFTLSGRRDVRNVERSVSWMKIPLTDEPYRFAINYSIYLYS